MAKSKTTGTKRTRAREKKPVSGTDEWSKFRENVLSGCEHDCRYCYAKTMAVQPKRMRPEEWCRSKTREKQANKKRFMPRDGTIMFPTTHDITPAHLETCLTFLGKMLEPGNRVLIVSKPHLECVRALCGRFRDMKG